MMWVCAVVIKGSKTPPVFVGIALLIIVMLVWWQPWRSSPPKLAVETLVEESVQRVLAATGRLKATETVSVQAKIGGQIKALHVREGVSVPKGTLLATLDDANQQAALTQAIAQQEALQPLVQQAQRDLARLISLRRLGLVAAVALDKQRAETLRLEADAVRLEALKTDAVARLEDTFIRAPFDAIVTSRFVDVGQVIDNKTVLFELVSRSGAYVEAEVDEAYAADLRQGQDVTLRSLVRHEGALKGWVSYVAPRIDARTGGRLVRVSFTPDERLLLPGQSLDLNILIDQRQSALTLPRTSIGEARSGPYVWQVGPHGVLKRQRIRVLDWPAERVVVLDGLQAGDVVVRQAAQVRAGVERIRPVRITETLGR